MAHKIKHLFKKKPAFPQVVNKNELTDLVKDMNERLTQVEQTLEQLVNKK